MKTPALPDARKLRLATKLTYGFGSIAYGIKDNGFSTLLLLFYNQVIGVPAGLVGAAILVALVLDAVLDPLIGRWSDHTRTRWGRRHPFMYAAALPVGLLYLLLWNPPVHAGQAAVLGYLVVTAILVRSAISFYEIPSSALAPELTADYHERTSVLGYRYLFGWLGGIAMLFLVFDVFLVPDATHRLGQLNPAGYHRYAKVASVAMVAAMLLSALGTHGEIAGLPKAAPSAVGAPGLWRGLAGTLRNRAFVILMVSGIFGYANQGLIFALNTYFNTFLWGFSAAVLFRFVASILVGVASAFLLATAASRRLGKRRAAAGCGVVYVVLAVAPLLLRQAGLFPANGSPVLLPVLLTTTMLAVAASVAGAILGASMMSDVVEDAQARNGERAEGVFFAGSFFMQKCVSGIGLFLSGGLLAWSHFPASRSWP